MAFLPLELGSFKTAVWSAAVFLETGVDPDPVMQNYRRRFPQPARFESWEAQLPDLKQLIDLEAISMAIVILLVFGVVAIGIACSFVIFIIRNMREYGILKAMGVAAQLHQRTRSAGSGGDSLFRNSSAPPQGPATEPVPAQPFRICLPTGKLAIIPQRG